MVISISASVLTAYYDAKEGVGAASSATSSSQNTAAAATPPWQSTSTAPKQSALVSSVLHGGQFFSGTAAQSSATSGTDASDYSNLFSLYQGVNALQGLAADAAASGVTPAQQASYAKAFSQGLSQLQNFLKTTGFNNVQVSQGAFSANDETTVGAPVETDDYTTGTIYSGPADGVVPAFSGDVQFAMNLTSTQGTTTTVNFDLSQMGDTPRTMANVVTYLNSQLKAAGATTQFDVVDTPAKPVTTTVAGKTVTLSTPPDNFALKIVGTDTENPTFTAPTSSPAVYVTATSGPAASAATATSAATSADQTQQVLTFNPQSATSTTTLTNTTALGSAVSSALASATAPDGTVYVLANVDGTTNGQTINGTQDVALMAYDSAGQLEFTRTLGAASAATGYSMAVSADGSVAIAGTVEGPLDGTEASEDQAVSATTPNSFVAVYDSSGNESWSSSQPALVGSAATGVTFGDNGDVYVTGTSQGGLPDSTSADGGDSAFVQGYSSTGALAFSTQFGTGATTPAGVAVSGDSLYVASNENGNAVVRQFNLSSDGGSASAGAVLNLGAVGSGSVAGIGVNSDGSIVVAGSTSLGDLSGGTVTSAYTGGSEGFVANLDPALSASASNLSYVSAGGDLRAHSMTLSGGQVYLAGSVTTAAPAGSGYASATDGYVAAVDPATGAVTWSQSFQGADDQASATSVAVSATGSSILSQLGLPNQINYAQSSLVVSNSSVTAGDSFSVQVGSGAAQKITIQPTDTLQTLATEIERASGYNATATTVTVNGETQLKITAANTTTSVNLLAGPAGADALQGLGLRAGEISDAANSTTTPGAKGPVTLGLNLPTTLNLNSAAAVSQAQSALALAAANIQTTYQKLTAPPPSSSSTSSSSSSAQTKALAAQISNYQSALTWLENNEGSSAATTSLLT